METYNITKSLSQYKTQLSLEKKNDNPVSSSSTKENTNKLTDMTFSHIMYTNDAYIKKMNKSTKNDVSHTFSTNTEFNEFIDNETMNTKQKLSWKQMPISWKIELCKNHMISDSSLNTNDVEKYINILCKDKDLFKHVKYDKKSATILKIDYCYLN